jgi:hypothetical protein
MNELLEKSLEEARNDTVIVFTDAGRDYWEQLKKKGYLNCTYSEKYEWDILFDMNDIDPHRRESASLWTILGPGRDSSIGRFLSVKDPTIRMGYVIKHLSDLVDAGYLKVEAK